MKKSIGLGCIALTLTLAAAHGSAPAPTPNFTISASNTTMPTTGTGAIPFTITSVSGYTGQIVVECMAPDPPPGVREPECGGGPIPAPIDLAANSSTTGDVPISPYVYVGPTLTGTLKHSGRVWERGPALAGLLMLGLGLRRRKVPGLYSKRLLLSCGLLIGLAGLNACGGVLTLTPGTYTYTLDAIAQANASHSVSTTLQVVVPPGVDVQDSITPL